MIKVGIIGITGRMGKMIASEINENEDTQIGTSCSKSGGSVEDTNKNNDVIIDFSVAQTSVLSASLAAKYGKPIVIGATGISLEEQKEIQKSAVKTAIVLASNMSLGVNLMFALTRKVAKMLDFNYDIEILEMHHNKKKDAPSGTALTLGKMAAEGRGIDFETHKETSREGLIGERKKGTIGLAVLRGATFPANTK
jgi:4-hydroxy-tetrahydrodipicolinate reductase